MEYQQLMKRILNHGEERPDRTGVGTRSLFGEQLRFDLRDGFPILTTKRVWFKGVVAELLWMLSGGTNVKELHEHGVHIWDEWADELGRLGPVYGQQWRAWGGWAAPMPEAVDQIGDLVSGLKKDPSGRRHIVTAWNPTDVPDMGLPCCHILMQFYSHTDRRLSCHMYQRSADYFLGVPFNIASYALLTRMIAQVTNHTLGDLVISFGDVHLYLNHLEQAREQTTREPRELPDLLVSERVEHIDGFRLSDFLLRGYDPHPALKAPIAV